MCACVCVHVHARMRACVCVHVCSTTSHSVSLIPVFTPILLRAQKRMDRQDAFGSTITAELRTLQGAPAPVRAPSNTRPPPPLVALSPPLAAAHPPPSVQPPPLPYLDNPIPSKECVCTQYCVNTVIRCVQIAVCVCLNSAGHVQCAVVSLPVALPVHCVITGSFVALHC